MFIQEIPTITLEDAENVKSLLVYFLGLLLILLVLIVRHLIKQNENRFKEKNELINAQKLVIASKENDIISIQSRLDKEVEFVKSISSSVSRVVTDNTNSLKSIIKSFEKLGIEVPNIKSVVESNNEISKDIKDTILKHILKD